MVPFEMLQQEFASPPRPCLLLQVDVDEAFLSHKVAQQQTLSGEGRDAGLGLHEALQLRCAGVGAALPWHPCWSRWAQVREELSMLIPELELWLHGHGGGP